MMRASAFTTRLSTVGLLSLSLAGCPDNQPTDTGGVDAGPLADVPGLDAPELDAPSTVDAPIGTDAPGPVTCTETGYPTLDLEAFASGFTQPVYMTSAPGTTDMFVVEVGGRIRVVDASGADGGVFLDIRDAVRNSGSQGDEQGLLGLAFHPDYATNGLFYVYYTDNATQDNVVAVGTRETPRTASPTVQVILRMDDFASNHNGGCLQFGPDGELYIATGDGGQRDDPREYGQDITQLLGKLLRIHVDATTGTSYTIPASNPFAAGGGAPEIFAYGLRNPWRFSFDRATGDLYIGDVGQDEFEEIDVVGSGEGAGLNFGWDNCEGFEGFLESGSTTGSACSFDHYRPVLAVSHGPDPVLTGGGQSITGGYVYRGSAIAGLSGAYIFADAYRGGVGAFRYCDGAMTEYQELPDLSGLCNVPVSFAEDSTGELYMVCYGNGSIRRIIGG